MWDETLSGLAPWTLLKAEVPVIGDFSFKVRSVLKGVKLMAELKIKCEPFVVEKISAIAPPNKS
ncbi:MAG TPA: hypothetical protein VK211_07955 [Kamptonema sp.]|nr:hypothetical protein [Kamptonema sp.]